MILEFYNLKLQKDGQPTSGQDTNLFLVQNNNF